jgi:hypothetical protein
MFGEALSIAKTVFGVLHKPLKAAGRKVHIWWFGVRSKRFPLDEAKAKGIAYSVLAGDILRVISYRNIDSPHIFIAVLRRSSEADFDPTVYVLKQIGQTYQVVWTSKRMFGATPAFLEAEDVDGDGHREIVFEDHSWGTGGGSTSLQIYSTARSRLFSLKESLNWQDRAGATAPAIEIESADVPEMIPVIEAVARRHGFLQPNAVVDFDSPDSGVQRWHKENGRRTSGIVKVHYHPGYPLTNPLWLQRSTSAGSSGCHSSKAPWLVTTS